MLVYFPAPHYNKNCNKTLAVEEFLRGDLGTSSGVVEGEMTGSGTRDDVLTTCKVINTHASQRLI